MRHVQRLESDIALVRGLGENLDGAAEAVAVQAILTPLLANIPRAKKAEAEFQSPEQLNGERKELADLLRVPFDRLEPPSSSEVDAQTSELATLRKSLQTAVKATDLKEVKRITGLLTRGEITLWKLCSSNGIYLSHEQADRLQQESLDRIVRTAMEQSDDWLQQVSLIADVLPEGRAKECVLSSTYRRFSEWATGKLFIENGDGKIVPMTFEDFPWIPMLFDGAFDECDECYVMKGAQTGVSSGAMAFCLFCLIVLNLNVIYVLPTNEAVTQFLRLRFKNFLKINPAVAKLVQVRGEAVTFGTHSILFKGAFKPLHLKSNPASVVVFDEVDEASAAALSLAKERTSGSTQKFFLAMSTATLENEGIHRHYRLHTQEVLYLQCATCKEWDYVTWPESFALDGEQSHLKCKHCSAKWTEREKRKLLSTAELRPLNLNANPRVRSVWLPQLLSATVSAAEVARKWTDAIGHDPLLREFWNSTLGLPYHASELDLSEDDIQNAIGNHGCSYGMYPAADGQWRFHTDGCDQGGPLNYVAVEWRLKPDFDPNHHSETDIHNYIGRVVGIFEVPPDANMTKWEQAFGKGGRYNLWYNFQIETSVVDLNPDQDSARRLAIGRNGPQRGKWRGSPLYLCRFDSAMAGKAIVENQSEFGDHGIAVDRAYAVGLVVSLIKNRNLELPFDMPQAFRKSLRKVHGEIAARNGVKRIEYNKRDGDDFALGLTYAVLAACQFIRRG